MSWPAVFDPLRTGRGMLAPFKRAEAAGSKVRFVDLGGDNPPTIVFFNDPDGYEIELYQAPSQ